MIKIDASKLRSDLLPKVRELRKVALGKETMTAVAEQGATIIHQRTSRGVDAEGASFKPYSKAYAKLRAKLGRSIKPDLTMTGRMLGAITSKFIANGKATIVFSKGQEALKALGNNARRAFFDIVNPREVDALGNELARQVDIQIKRAGLGGSA